MRGGPLQACARRAQALGAFCEGPQRAQCPPRGDEIHIAHKAQCSLKGRKQVQSEMWWPPKGATTLSIARHSAPRAAPSKGGRSHSGRWGGGGRCWERARPRRGREM